MQLSNCKLFITHGQKVLPNAPVFKITFQRFLICDVRTRPAKR